MLIAWGWYVGAALLAALMGYLIWGGEDDKPGGGPKPGGGKKDPQMKVKCRIGGTSGVTYTDKTLEWCRLQGGEAFDPATDQPILDTD